MEGTGQGVQDSRATCPRIMTARKAAKETNIPEHLIRVGIREGWTPGFWRGNRYYVNVDALITYLNNCGTTVRR